jgi:hypothetical protein
MASLTAVANNDTASVELTIDFDMFLVENQVTIVRVEPDGTEHVVRGGYRIMMFPVTLDYFLIDSEAPLDVVLTYRAFEDTAGLDPHANEIISNPVTLASSGFNWFKDPARPWANIRVDLCPYNAPCTGTDGVSLIRLGDKTRASDANLIPVLDRELPADIWARRKGIVSSVTFLTRSLAAIDSVYDLFTAGGPLLLQFQALFGWDDAYWQPGELTETYTGSADQRLPYRLWSVPLTQVDQPSPAQAAQGTACSNWCTVEDTYATSQDLADTGLTWQDVADCTATVLPVSGYGFGPPGLGYGFGPYGNGG